VIVAGFGGQSRAGNQSWRGFPGSARLSLRRGLISAQRTLLERSALIISESHEFVFIHNPKCGGTTIRNALMKFDTTDNFFWSFVEREKGTRNFSQFQKNRIDKAHMPMHILRSLYPHYFSLLNSYFVFVVVRNPYDRAVSAFNETHKGLLKNSPGNLDEFILALNVFWEGAEATNVKGWNFKFRHSVLQRDMVYIGSKRLADLTIKAEDWDAGISALAKFRPEVCDALIRARPQNVKPNSIATMDVLSKNSIKRINELYESDFVLFDYDMV
jgi:Sulfotransferase family